MTLKNWFEKQRKLDHYIETTQAVTQDSLFTKKQVAFLVELGELANETRCFKFWSKKPASEKSIILEEYIDGFHFLLSLGIELGFENETEWKEEQVDTDLTSLFKGMYQELAVLSPEVNIEKYQHLFSMYISLGSALGFTRAEMEAAYDEKNAINYQRQESGY
ncbi:dUTP diphosphatase [Mangrovibacillus cuniculi]|uniref:dUTPase n=1 Tax=Mangrovibacillus cuniculi TaxID=2593652 RepID=A0A7S8CBZ7_9BACI|nr:dUTP diphosphatase [Mangrovibacillus cuniculi]QPC47178.1 dUTPase [Mangrovibacillus cuniculi]